MAAQPLLLSRTLRPEDYTSLDRELTLVTGYDLGDAHPQRRWVYALALHAVARWRAAAARGGRAVRSPLYDVGGHGSLFYQMLGDWTGTRPIVVDPAHRTARLEEFVTSGVQLADVVTGLSVLEHVDEVDRFLYYLACLVAPGGLLVLVVDYWNTCGKDTAAGHQHRKRIFCPKRYAALRATALSLQLQPFGGVDLGYHGPQVHDYTYASLVLEKRV
jgi:hypothetical protein